MNNKSDTSPSQMIPLAISNDVIYSLDGKELKIPIDSIKGLRITRDRSNTEPKHAPTS